MMKQSSYHSSRWAGLSIISTLLTLFLSIQFSSSTKICPPYLPVKRSYAIATCTAAMLPRGGGAAKLSSATTATAPLTTSNNVAINILKSFIQTVANARSHLAAAAAARAVSIFGMYPVDTIKTRMQMRQSDAFRLGGIYKGVTGSLVGQVPYG